MTEASAGRDHQRSHIHAEAKDGVSNDTFQTISLASASWPRDPHAHRASSRKEDEQRQLAEDYNGRMSRLAQAAGNTASSRS